MKGIIIALATIAFAKMSFAQNSLNLGFETAFAKETFTSNFNSIGLGINCSYWVAVSKTDNITFNSGVLKFFDFSQGSSEYYIPLRVGYAKELFKSRFGLFGDVGLGSLKNSDYSHRNISYQAGLFYKFKLKNQNSIQVNWAYTYMRFTRYVSNDYYDWGTLGVKYNFKAKRKK